MLTGSGESPAFGQITNSQVQQYILSNKSDIAEQVQLFYLELNYQTAWIQHENNFNQRVLFQALNSASDFGLRKQDYHHSLVESIQENTISLNTKSDSLAVEVKITEAALNYFRDLAYGNVKPVFGYNGLAYTPDCHNIPVLLADHVSRNCLSMLRNRITPPLPEIGVIEQRIAGINAVLRDSSFDEVTISSKKVSSKNRALVLKLFQLGIVESPHVSLPDLVLIEKVKEVQRQFNLMADGVLRTTILQELNIPLRARLQQLSLAINYYRWLNCLTQSQSVIVVNVPAAYMKVYSRDKVILEMKMVVGKRSTPTPTLASKVTEVILYPYWHVPRSIATKELLPILKRFPGYIDEGNYQVLNKAGKIMDPYAINWHALSSTNFPYLLRQSTGCDNALGLLKLSFYSPFGVYLHDTPIKSSFMLKKRYFSHGCMRMEKPFDLGHLVLKNNRIAIGTLEQKGCLRNQAPITVPAAEHMAVIVWYNPVGIDSSGRVLFFEDIYEKFDLSGKKQRLERGNLNQAAE